MTKEIEYYYDIVQGTDEWLRIKHGVLSASTLKNVITAKTLKVSGAATMKLFYDELLSQRIDETLPENFCSYDMQRGLDDEPYAIQQYEEQYGRTDGKHCGFVINRKLGFDLGFSPDRLLGDDGFIETKSKKPNHQIKTILDHVCGRTDEIIPSEHMMQCQAGLFITERDYCEFLSYSNGMQMVRKTVEPINQFQDAIQEAAIIVEGILQKNMEMYLEAVANSPDLTLSERRDLNTGEMT